ncbi:hypothetical protein [Streptomyces galbus]|uniref:hypothetical protein n=1 Tax=Streptomyces galbus TaxID=33898 RepID=UPI0019A7F880|nr:hypothetical protein [Streptomyces galbus]GHD52557.1 hypothetical protein GCM10010335_65260 [Streptomyces galbus]
MLDLMSALQQSVAKAKASRGEDKGEADVHEMPASKKKTAKKAPAKTTAAKKTTTAKKTAARRPRSA